MSDTVQIPNEWRPPYRKDSESRYFATLDAYWRHPEWNRMQHGTYGRFHQVERDEPLANEFRAQLVLAGSELSVPLGNNRERAEMLVQTFNRAFQAGLDQAARPRIPPVLVGRMGHINRNEELMP